MAAAPSEII